LLKQGGDEETVLPAEKIHGETKNHAKDFQYAEIQEIKSQEVLAEDCSAF
jgi:hypothetical protein